MFHPNFSDIATLLPLAPSGFAVPYKNHPLPISSSFFSSYGKLAFVLLPSLRFSRPSLRFEAKGLLCPVPEKFPFFR